jgi:hypothetical protein
MKWKDVTHAHNGAVVEVSAGSTPIEGFIICREEGAMPVLQSGRMIHSFAWYWDVKIVDWKGLAV